MTVRSLALIVMLGGAPLAAQSFNFPDFSNVTNLAVNGSATQVGLSLRLTQAATAQLSTVYFSVPVSVVLGFDTTFLFQIANQGGLAPGGADGMVFIIHNDPAGASAMGVGGGSLSYGGPNGTTTGAITNSLVIEIADTWINGGTCPDLSTNEISVHTGGTLGNSSSEAFSLGSVTPSVLMSDGAPHTMRILYVPGQLDIFLDNLTVPVLTVPYDFGTGGTYSCMGNGVGGLNLLGGSNAWVGFGASTGGAFQEQDLLTWQWNSTGLPACFEGTVGLGAGGPFDVLQVNGSAGGFQRKVSLLAFSPLSFGVVQPPSSAGPDPFIIFARTGLPQVGGAFNTPFGALCFPPAVIPQPGLFVLADSFSLNLGALLPATPTPWSLALPAGLPIALTFTLQGVILEAPGNFSITNAVQVEVAALAPPTIASVAPLSSTPGATISVTGTDFNPALMLSVDGTPVTPSSITATQVNFPFPAGTACDATLTITNPDGQAASAALNPTPQVVTLIPNPGPAAGGAPLILIGSGFAPGSAVTVGGNPVASIISVSSTSLSVITPAGTVGSAQVVVTTPGGCTASATYTYQ